MSYQPKKHLGQHFLTDDQIIQRMLRQMHIKANDHVIEIGPGQGALTHTLMNRGSSFACVEFDSDMVDYLSQRYPDLTIFQQDALTFDFREYAQTRTLRVVGNLPYNISTPILFHLLDQVECIQDMHLMLQKEVVQRICAQPHSKTYGRLSVMVQYMCQCEYLFDVKDSAFSPPPKVHSAVVHITPYHQDNFPYAKVDIKVLNNVVAKAFSQRRKTLRNSLKLVFNAQALNNLPIDLSLRPENLSVADFVTLAQYAQETGEE